MRAQTHVRVPVECPSLESHFSGTGIGRLTVPKLLHTKFFKIHSAALELLQTERHVIARRRVFPHFRCESAKNTRVLGYVLNERPFTVALSVLSLPPDMDRT
jgi:hypothetical protein